MSSASAHFARVCSDARIRAEIARLVAARGVDKTVCPSEVARALSPDWRPLMELVRRVAREMAAEGTLEIRQAGQRKDPDKARGAIRLALPRP